MADDFTGAADAALALWERGWSAEIWTPAAPGFPFPPATSAWIVDTQSRHLPPAAAAARVRQAVKALRGWGAEFLYKKIDSTLRGPLAAELEAFVEDLPTDEPLPLVPAFPQAGRQVKKGELWVEGRPLHKTAFNRDPRSPVRGAGVAARTGGKVRVWVPDVLTEEDLDRAAVRATIAAAGSGGFLAALAKRWGGKARPAGVSRARRAVVVAGSAHPRTGEQLDYLARHLPPRADVKIFSVPAKKGAPGAVLAALIRRAARQKTPGARWVAAGGETAFALARRWAAPRWRVKGKVVPGVALCRAAGSHMELVLKPGGFGAPDALARALGPA